MRKGTAADRSGRTREARGAARRLRIIGGRWRGRRLVFPADPALRPTPDRVRETLFNWLREVTPGARCLDLFAGSGALGLEALSREAASVVFVEQSRPAAAAIGGHLETLGAENGRVYCGDAFTYLRGAPQAYDIVFLDPPFGSGRLVELCTLLETRGWLAGRACVYIEADVREEPPELPENWRIHRRGRAGQVAYSLALRRAGKQQEKGA